MLLILDMVMGSALDLTGVVRFEIVYALDRPIVFMGSLQTINAPYARKSSLWHEGAKC